MAIGVVVGLAMEARPARPLGGVIATGGGTAEGAETAAEALAAGGVSALVSFGLAGGLDPRLKPGHLLIPRAVLAAGETWPTDRALARLLGGPTVELILGEGAVVTSAAAKHQLWRHHRGGRGRSRERGGRTRGGTARPALRCAPRRVRPGRAHPAARGACRARRGGAGARAAPARLRAAPPGGPARARRTRGRLRARVPRARRPRPRRIGALGPSPVLGDSG